MQRTNRHEFADRVYRLYDSGYDRTARLDRETGKVRGSQSDDKGPISLIIGDDLLRELSSDEDVAKVISMFRQNLRNGDPVDVIKSGTVILYECEPTYLPGAPGRRQPETESEQEPEASSRRPDRDPAPAATSSV